MKYFLALSALLIASTSYAQTSYIPPGELLRQSAAKQPQNIVQPSRVKSGVPLHNGNHTAAEALIKSNTPEEREKRYKAVQEKMKVKEAEDKIKSSELEKKQLSEQREANRKICLDEQKTRADGKIAPWCTRFFSESEMSVVLKR